MGAAHPCRCSSTSRAAAGSHLICAMRSRVAVLLLWASTALAAPVIPAHVPNVWGGAAFGAALGHSSHLFAFSGADGPVAGGAWRVGLATRSSTHRASFYRVPVPPTAARDDAVAALGPLFHPPGPFAPSTGAALR